MHGASGVACCVHFAVEGCVQLMNRQWRSARPLSAWRCSDDLQRAIWFGGSAIPNAWFSSVSDVLVAGGLQGTPPLPEHRGSEHHHRPCGGAEDFPVGEAAQPGQDCPVRDSGGFVH